MKYIPQTHQNTCTYFPSPRNAHCFLYYN